jgi:hypothetical protein
MKQVEQTIKILKKKNQIKTYKCQNKLLTIFLEIMVQIISILRLMYTLQMSFTHTIT